MVLTRVTINGIIEVVMFDNWYFIMSAPKYIILR